MTDAPLRLSSLRNPKVKRVVKLRQRSHRDELGLTIIEGYREIKRALDNGHGPGELFFCRDCFQGTNEDSIIDRAESEFMANAIDGAQLQVIPDAGHMVAYEQADRFNRTLREWLESNGL